MGAQVGEHLGGRAALGGGAMIGVIAGDALGSQPFLQDRVLSLQRPQPRADDLSEA